MPVLAINLPQQYNAFPQHQHPYRPHPTPPADHTAPAPGSTPTPSPSTPAVSAMGLSTPSPSAPPDSAVSPASATHTAQSPPAQSPQPHTHSAQSQSQSPPLNPDPAPAPPSPPTMKRKPSRRANTAERRATHNAVERQRRETLNGRFLVSPFRVAALCPLSLPLVPSPAYFICAPSRNTPRHRSRGYPFTRSVDRQHLHLPIVAHCGRVWAGRAQSHTSRDRLLCVPAYPVRVRGVLRCAPAPAAALPE
ncbi:hypothetical protein JB92DRAFT_1735911 [Gautieria morchelliformis]|nr:hypothetical protein JB92DRAFT_1735911 [Gautieria morchelliformis]